MNKYTIGVLVTVAGASAFFSSGAPGLDKVLSMGLGTAAPAQGRDVPAHVAREKATRR